VPGSDLSTKSCSNPGADRTTSRLTLAGSITK
jgi:hypothetical protein